MRARQFVPVAALVLVTAFTARSVVAQQTAQSKTAPQATETATQFYMKYRAVFEKAKTVDEIKPFMSADVRKQMDAQPAAERADTFKMIKAMDTHKNIKVTKEDLTSAGATLTVEAVDETKAKVTGTISLIKENGAWKLASESWKS